ncbi:hypothetical protein ACH4YO_42410 [Streptomyces noursei]|uniref:hypothetical protein n=1 Tax=Streptomyces noursei TaxID=1971 RepID=UPI0033E108D5
MTVVGATTLFPASATAKTNPSAQDDAHPTTVWARQYGILFDSKYRPVDLPSIVEVVKGIPTVYPGQNLLFAPAAMLYGKDVVDKLVLTITIPKKNGLSPVNNDVVDTVRSNLHMTCNATSDEVVKCTWKNAKPIAEDTPSYRGWGNEASDLVNKIDLKNFNKDNGAKILESGTNSLGYVAPFALVVTDKHCKGSVSGKVKVEAYSKNKNDPLASDEQSFSADIDIDKIKLNKGDRPIRCTQDGKNLEWYYDPSAGIKRVRVLGPA